MASDQPSSGLRFGRCMAGLLLLAGFAGAALANTATEPIPRNDLTPERNAGWMKLHEDFSGQARRGGIDVLFVGDSITGRWRTKGKEVWPKYFGQLHAANFGIDGDRTQHLLWRLQNGELEGIAPRVVVLMIGTNNIDPKLGQVDLKPRNTEDDIFAGVVAVVAAIQDKLPKAKVLLLGIFPRGDPQGPIEHQIEAINARLAAHAFGPNVLYRDMGRRLLGPDGKLSTEIMNDLIHPTEKGYEIWGAALVEELKPLLPPAS